MNQGKNYSFTKNCSSFGKTLSQWQCVSKNLSHLQPQTPGHTCIWGCHRSPTVEYLPCISPSATLQTVKCKENLQQNFCLLSPHTHLFILSTCKHLITLLHFLGKPDLSNYNILYFTMDCFAFISLFYYNYYAQGFIVFLNNFVYR